MSYIKSGDVVVLKFGGPKMTVTDKPYSKNDELFVPCKCFSEDFKAIFIDTFNMRTLEIKS